MGGGRGVLSERVEFLEGCFNWSRMLGALERILKGKVWYNNIYKHMANSRNLMHTSKDHSLKINHKGQILCQYFFLEYSSAHRPARACISQVGVS